MTELNQTVPGPAAPGAASRRWSPATTGPLFDRMDLYALIAIVVMNLAPLAMAAFWAPYH